jgi:drug/metabolite transporter (DMT)-like permease
LGFEFWLGFSACFCGVSLTIGAVDFKGSGLQDLHNFHLLSLLALMGAVATSTTYRAQLDLLTQKIPPLEISTTIFVINGFLSSVLILPWVDPMPGGAFRLVLWMGIAAALANVAFLSAIKLIGSTRMSIFDMIQRPLVIVGAALALKEPLGPLQILGIALVLGGVRLAKVKRRVEQQPLRELRG